MKTRQRIPRIPFLAPAPFGVEVMTLARLRAMAAPAYLAAPQRPAFHLLMLSSAGAATHIVDFRSYRLGTGHAVWVRPGQVQTFSDPLPSGELVLFQPDFLIPNTRAADIADDRFGQVGIEFSPVAAVPIDRARRALRREYATAIAARETTTPVQTETLRHLLSVLILKLSGDAPGDLVPGPDSLYARFRDLLERDFAVAHDVAHYADALGYSTRTLARATQASTGRTPKQAIQDRLTLEARRLLAHTDLPASMIAAQLGFRDPSNFSTFFARQSGLAPTASRQQQRRTQGL